MKRFFIGLLLAFLSLATPALAQKPDGVPAAVVPDYNVTIAVWADHTPLGDRIAVWELQNGNWSTCGNCSTFPVNPLVVPLTTGSMEGDIAAQGGSLDAYLSNVGKPIINVILRSRFPPFGQPPTSADPIVQINWKLGIGYQLRGPQTVNGSETIEPK